MSTRRRLSSTEHSSMTVRRQSALNLRPDVPSVRWRRLRRPPNAPIASHSRVSRKCVLMLSVCRRGWTAKSICERICRCVPSERA
jgi:hypothetical protein